MNDEDIIRALFDAATAHVSEHNEDFEPGEGGDGAVEDLDLDEAERDEADYTNLPEYKEVLLDISSIVNEDPPTRDLITRFNR